MGPAGGPFPADFGDFSPTLNWKTSQIALRGLFYQHATSYIEVLCSFGFYASTELHKIKLLTVRKSGLLWVIEKGADCFLLDFR